MHQRNPAELHNAVVAALTLAPHAIIIGSVATRLHGATQPRKNASRSTDLDLIWTGHSDTIVNAARTAFTRAEWRWKKSPLRGHSLETPATDERCAVEIMTADSWILAHEARWHPYAGHSIRVASRETLAAMKLALLAVRDKPRDAADLRMLHRLGTNANDAVRELTANISHERVRIVHERTRTLYQGMDWQRALARHLDIPCHEDNAEKTWRIHPWYCPQRRRWMSVLRESLRFTNGTLVEHTAAHYDAFDEALDAARRGDAARTVHHSPCYDAQRTAAQPG